MVGGLTSLSQFYLGRQGTQTTGIELIYNPGEDIANVSGTVGFTLKDADWAQANLRIYDIYQQLGAIASISRSNTAEPAISSTSASMAPAGAGLPISPQRRAICSSYWLAPVPKFPKR